MSGYSFLGLRLRATQRDGAQLLPGQFQRTRNSSQNRPLDFVQDDAWHNYVSPNALETHIAVSEAPRIQVCQVTQESRGKRGTSHRREGPNEAASVVGVTSLESQNESARGFVSDVSVAVFIRWTITNNPVSAFARPTILSLSFCWCCARVTFGD